MAEDESFLALRTRGTGFQLVEFVRWDGDFDYLLHFETLTKQKQKELNILIRLTRFEQDRLAGSLASTSAVL
jgi:hypothetical protein